MSIENILPLLEGGKLLPLVEDFYSVQGEGYNTGKAAYFIRLGGCDVGCKWCDAKESWNPRNFPPVSVVTVIERAMECKAKSIVITGGEPLLYPLDILTRELKSRGVEIFLETSGSSPFSGIFDWVCLSPKRKLQPLEQSYGMADELKVIIEDFDTDIEWAKECAAKVKKSTRLYLQPEWSKMNQNMPLIVEFVKENPQWSISLQTHKFMRIP
ncbi:MAG: 7-carboxy-7-deazaguanine synthase QueE [Rikenellaceae bacterium]